jgi:tRNA(Arg) A34 adenosine deaminase TadA
MNATVERLKVAASLAKEGRSLAVGDVLVGSEDTETLTVTGWTNATSLETITTHSALTELHEIKSIYRNMLEACPDLLELAGKKTVKLRLGFDYGMGAVWICSELNNIVAWETELKS